MSFVASRQNLSHSWWLTLTACFLFVLVVVSLYASAADPDTRFFQGGTTHIIATWCSCNWIVVLTLDKLPFDIDWHDFESGWVCQSCGAKWPQVVRYSVPKSRWWVTFGELDLIELYTERPPFCVIVFLALLRYNNMRESASRLRHSFTEAL